MLEFAISTTYSGPLSLNLSACKMAVTVLMVLLMKGLEKTMPVKPQMWYRGRNVCFVTIPAAVNITECPVSPHVPTQWSIMRWRFGRGTWAARAPPLESTCRSMARTARQKCSSSPAARKFLIVRPRTHSRYAGFRQWGCPQSANGCPKMKGLD